MKYLVYLNIIITFSFVAEAEENYIIIADNLDWENYPAYYIDLDDTTVDLPKLIKSIKKVTNLLDCKEQDKTTILCEGNFRYFVSVNGSGIKLNSGRFCSSYLGIPFQKYYAERLLELAKCGEFEWDAEQEEYYIDWDESD